METIKTLNVNFESGDGAHIPGLVDYMIAEVNGTRLYAEVPVFEKDEWENHNILLAKIINQATAHGIDFEDVEVNGGATPLNISICGFDVPHVYDDFFETKKICVKNIDEARAILDKMQADADEKMLKELSRHDYENAPHYYDLAYLIDEDENGFKLEF